MDQNFLQNNPMLQNMSPEKLQFLMSFANAKKPNSMQEMMPFLLSFINSAQSKNIQFSTNETDLLINILKQNMTPDESAKADKIIQMMRNRQQ